MTKEELIAKMAMTAGITKVAASNALSAFTDSVTASLKKGKRVSLVNFGTFLVAKRKARIGRNPRTGESLRIPAARVPKFSAGKALTAAAFVQDEIRLHDRLSLTVGARYDDWRTYDAASQAAASLAPVAFASRAASAVTGKAALV